MFYICFKYFFAMLLFVWSISFPQLWLVIIYLVEVSNNMKYIKYKVERMRLESAMARVLSSVSLCRYVLPVASRRYIHWIQPTTIRLHTQSAWRRDAGSHVYPQFTLKNIHAENTPLKNISHLINYVRFFLSSIREFREIVMFVLWFYLLKQSTTWFLRWVVIFFP